MRLLKLTLVSGQEIWINTAHIVSFQTVADQFGKGTHTYVDLDYPDGGVSVTQTPEQIMSLLGSGR